MRQVSGGSGPMGPQAKVQYGSNQGQQQYARVPDNYGLQWDKF